MVLYSNYKIDGIKSTSELEYFKTQNHMNINELYHSIEKTYTYYLLIEEEITLPISINKIIDVLKDNKPAILYLDRNIKVYHRSIIHYIFPHYPDINLVIPKILEFPLKEYVLNLNLDIKYKNDREINKYQNLKSNCEIFFNWFKSAIKYNIPQTYEKYCEYFNYKNEFNLQEENVEDINYLNKFNIHNFFDTSHKYFNSKNIKFKKYSREIHGEAGLFHFAHDFGYSQRNNFINHLIHVNKYNKYLEIGTNNCYNFDDIIANYKVGVDPQPVIENEIYQKNKKLICIMKSEDFFKKANKNLKFDLIYIDGCLLEHSLENDILSALNHLSTFGTIVVHDCNPPNEYFQRDKFYEQYVFQSKSHKIDQQNVNMNVNTNVNKNLHWNTKEYDKNNWNGKAWKIIVKLRYEREDLKINVVDSDWGLGIIQKGYNSAKKVNTNENIYDYNTFKKYRKELLGLISVKEFLKIYSKNNVEQLLIP